VRGAHARRERLRAAARVARRLRETRALDESARFASDRSGSAGPSKGRLSNGAPALMREANEISSGAHARQKRGVRQRSAPFRNFSSPGFKLREKNRRVVQRFARLCP